MGGFQSLIMKKKIHILPVIEQNILAEGITLILSKKPRIDCYQNIREPADIYEVIRKWDPDLVLMAPTIGHVLSTFSMIALIREYYNNISIIFISPLISTSIFRHAMMVKVNGYISVDDTIDGLFTAIDTVVSGRQYLSPGVEERLQLYGINLLQDDIHWDYLTETENRIINMKFAGYRRREISEELGIRPSTVSTHLKNIARKLHFSSTSELDRMILSTEQTILNTILNK